MGSALRVIFFTTLFLNLHANIIPLTQIPNLKSAI
jgi:hypothetical protein